MSHRDDGGNSSIESSSLSSGNSSSDASDDNEHEDDGTDEFSSKMDHLWKRWMRDDVLAHGAQGAK